MKDDTKLGIAVSLFLAIIASGIPGNDFAAIGIGLAGGFVLALSIFYEAMM
ncbi:MULTISPECIES: hypothetical protein [Halomicrobium]|uniref:Uncharacterized protein n=1 Tax=Halomicrobium mukohataei (strain ATCC 700874 / DSM 12286 / JCM 9738 / NCIMB 13541) TaxID=485914 RepID=C7P0P0_HALMD|nr:MULTISPECIES: hypothetical protein [Halomicrobium]ACV47022.1 hypothetical protein Hmuk_0892 [Halomicrobium mukohataei DSM 12286]